MFHMALCLFVVVSLFSINIMCILLVCAFYLFCHYVSGV